MARYYRLTYMLSRGAAIIAAIALVGMVCHIGIEILLRYFFSSSTFVVDEFVGYGLVICTVWSLGYTLEHEHMIRVDLGTRKLPPKVENILLSVSAFVTAFCTSGLAWFFFQRAERAWERGSTSYSIAKVPVTIPESLMMIGLVIFTLQLIAFGLRHLTGHASCANIDPNEFLE